MLDSMSHATFAVPLGLLNPGNPLKSVDGELLILGRVVSVRDGSILLIEMPDMGLPESALELIQTDFAGVGNDLNLTLVPGDWESEDIHATLEGGRDSGNMRLSKEYCPEWSSAAAGGQGSSAGVAIVTDGACIPGTSMLLC